MLEINSLECLQKDVFDFCVALVLITNEAHQNKLIYHIVLIEYEMVEFVSFRRSSFVLCSLVF